MKRPHPHAARMSGIRPSQRQAFRDLILARTGLRLGERDLPKLDEFIARRMKARGLSDPEQYFRLLQTQSEIESRAEWERVAGGLTVGESYFFRDKGQFALLRNRILPELIARRSAARSLRIWSAGCSSGEEPYSLAMLLDELLPRPDEWRLNILATDINREALGKARTARYSQWSFRQMDPALRERFFVPIDREWQVKERFRQSVTFQPGNLVTDSYPRPDSGPFEMDLIVCRNVFIYFNPETVGAILGKFERTLRPDGYLLTGHGELLGCQFDRLQACSFPESVIYCRRDAAPPELPTAAPQVAGAGEAPAGWTFQPAPPPPAPSPPTRMVPPSIPVAPAPLGPVADPLKEAERFMAGGKYEAAIAALQAPATGSRGQVKALTLMAQAHANLGQYDQAIRCCRSALATDNLAVPTHYLLAQLIEGHGKHEEAIAILRQVLYLDPRFSAAYLDLGALYDRDGDAARARQMRVSALEVLKSLPPDTVVSACAPMSAAELIAHVQTLISAG